MDDKVIEHPVGKHPEFQAAYDAGVNWNYEEKFGVIYDQLGPAGISKHQFLDGVLMYARLAHHMFGLDWNQAYEFVYGLYFKTKTDVLLLDMRYVALREQMLNSVLDAYQFEQTLT